MNHVNKKIYWMASRARFSFWESTAASLLATSWSTALTNRGPTRRQLQGDAAEHIPIFKPVVQISEVLMGKTSIGERRDWKRQAAGTPVVNAVLQDVANKLAAVDSQKLKRALDAIQ